MSMINTTILENKIEKLTFSIRSLIDTLGQKEEEYVPKVGDKIEVLLNLEFVEPGDPAIQDYYHEKGAILEVTNVYIVGQEDSEVFRKYGDMVVRLDDTSKPPATKDESPVHDVSLCLLRKWIAYKYVKVIH